MKKTISMMAAIALSAFVIAQEPVIPDTTKRVVAPPNEQPVVSPTQQNSTTPTAWDYKKNATVDSINAKYKDQMAPARAPLTTEQIFPVLGQYTSTENADAASVSVSLDAQNKGVIWIDGLPQGRISAMLRKSPAVYKIPAQKTEDGKDVAEGTLVFDNDVKSLNIVIGKPYVTADPLSVFAPEASTEEQPATVVKTKTKTATAKTKTKTVIKPWTYSGTKIETTTAMNPIGQ